MQVSSIEKPKKAKNIRTVRETHYASEFSACEPATESNTKPFFYSASAQDQRIRVIGT